MFKKVVVGMSGGVDSAVTALLLKNKGFNVTCVFMKNWDVTDETGKCMVEEDYEDAKWVCERLKLPLVQVNFVKEYWNNVFSDIIDNYQNGKTPNPDIACNRSIKFNRFFHLARTVFQADAIATGHYARTSFGPHLEYYKPNTNVRLLKAQDENKDQTFFLSQVPQEALRYYMFPLGDYLKSEVKKIALEAGLHAIAKKKESMGICFVGKREFQNFISEYIEDKPGDFIDIDSGLVVGKHLGIHHWTTGQRCRISSGSKAYFVFWKDIESNTIFVVNGTNHPALYTDFLTTESAHWITTEPSALNHNYGILNCDFRFQHRNSVIPCKVHKTLDNQLVVQLSQPLRAITKGQFAVFYQQEECLGSAPISYPGPSYFSLDRTLNLEDRFNDQNSGITELKKERLSVRK